MNRRTAAAARAGLSLLLVATGLAVADAYDLNWWTADGGGQMWSTGGGYTLGGTLGQHDADLAAPMTGGNYTLTGGFWVSTLTAPAIRRGDLNCDGTYGYLSFGDINPFVKYITNFTAWQAAYPACPPENGDINGDGTCGQSSFGDINPFVALLTSGQ